MIRLFLVLALLILVSCDKPLSGHVLRITLGQDVSSVLRRNVDGELEKTSIHFEVFKWLSAKLGFKYIIYPFGTDTFVNTSVQVGAATYLLTGVSDMHVGTVTMTDDRYKIFDLPYPWFVGPFQLVIPTTEAVANFGAPWQPFDYQAWICIILSIICITVALYYVNQSSYVTGRRLNLSNSIEYVTVVLFSQGGVCFPTKLCVRLVAAAWCIGAFFIVNSYSTTLISRITASIERPLINSVYDLPKKPNILVVVEEGRGPDGVFAGAQNGILKYISDTLNREPSSRCRRTEQCFEKVAEGRHVFVQIRVMVAIYMNKFVFPKYGKCQLTVAKEGFMNSLASVVLPKNSPYTYYINRETIRLAEIGLINKWYDDFFPLPKVCGKDSKGGKRIGLTNLSSSFAILGAGIAISFVVFIFELLVSFGRKYEKK